MVLAYRLTGNSSSDVELSWNGQWFIFVAKIRYNFLTSVSLPIKIKYMFLRTAGLASDCCLHLAFEHHKRHGSSSRISRSRRRAKTSPSRFAGVYLISSSSIHSPLCVIQAALDGVRAVRGFDAKEWVEKKVTHLCCPPDMLDYQG